MQARSDKAPVSAAIIQPVTDRVSFDHSGTYPERTVSPGLQRALMAASLLCLLALLANSLMLLPIHAEFTRASVGNWLLAICASLVFIQFGLLVWKVPHSSPRPDQGVSPSLPIVLPALQSAAHLPQHEAEQPPAVLPELVLADAPAPDPVPELPVALLEPEQSLPMDIVASIGQIGDRQIWDEIMEAFHEETTGNFVLIREALSSSDQILLERSVHSIKGGSSEVLAEGLRSLSAEAEQLARAGDFAGVSAMLGELEAEYQRVLAHCKSFLDSESAAASS